MEKKHTSSNGKKMSRSQAGRMGGDAPHKCRGRECSSKTSSKNGSTNKSHTNSNKKSSDSWF